MGPGQARPNVEEVRSALDRVHRDFLEGYLHWGGFRHHGWTEQSDGANYRGPAVWSEADVVLRLARSLEREFPDQVHAEFNIANWTRADYDKAKDRNQRIDIAVSDTSMLGDGPHAQEHFRKLAHTLFIEVKWMPKGWWGETWEGLEARKRVASIAADATRLARHLELGRCMVASVFVVDDECLFDHLRPEFEWPDSVHVLTASPSALVECGHGDDDAVRVELARIDELVSNSSGE